MSIVEATPRVQYTASGSATFSFPWPIWENADIFVQVGDTVKTYATDYTLSYTAGDAAGGTVTFVSAPASGSTVTLYREKDHERTSDFATSGPFDMVTMNTQLDRITAQVQDLRMVLARKAGLAQSSTESSLPALPTPEAGKVLGYDASADYSNLSLTADETWAGLADLALKTSGKGSDLVGVVGAGSLITVTEALAGPWLDLRRYGASTSNTGAANTAAWDAAVVVLQALGGGTIFLPAGTFDFENLTLDGGYAINVVGAGSCPWIYEGWSGHKGDNAATFIRHDSGDTGILLEIVGGTWPRGRIRLAHLNLIGNANTTTVLRCEGIQRSLTVDDIVVGVHQDAARTNPNDALGVELYCCWYVNFNQVEIYQWTHSGTTGQGTPIDNIALGGNGIVATVTATGDIHATERSPVVGDMVQIRGMATLGLNDYWTITGYTEAADQLTFSTTEHADAWATTTRYSADDIVLSGGVVYRCLTTHLSGGGAFPGVGANWEILATEAAAPTGSRLRWRTGHGVGLKIWNHPGDTYNGAFNMSHFNQCFISNFERCLQLGETNAAGDFSRYINGVAFTGGAIQEGYDYGLYLGSGVEAVSFTGMHIEQCNRGLFARYGARNATFRNSKMHDNNTHIDLWQDGAAPKKGSPNFLAEQLLLTGTARGIRVQGGSGTGVMRFRQINMVPAEDGGGIGLEVRGNSQSVDLVIDGIVFNDDNAVAGPTEFAHRIIDQLGSVRIADHRKRSSRAITSDLTLTTNHSNMLFTNNGAGATVTFTLPDPADRDANFELPLTYRFFQMNGAQAVRIAPLTGHVILEAVNLDPTVTSASTDPVTQADFNTNIKPTIGADSDAITGTGANYMEAAASAGMKAYAELEAIDDDTWLVTRQWGKWNEGP